jgi:formamidopyrimidine-DNA glycosylase
LHLALHNQPIIAISARLRAAKAWLQEHPELLIGRRIERVWSHGKNLIGEMEGGYHFVSHLMMWGRWQVLPNSGELERDRRERARIVTPHTMAILFSAPVFEIGTGNPYDNFDYLRALGPDTLPYSGDFDQSTFLARLTAPAQQAAQLAPLCSTRRFAPASATICAPKFSMNAASIRGAPSKISAMPIWNACAAWCR